MASRKRRTTPPSSNRTAVSHAAVVRNALSPDWKIVALAAVGLLLTGYLTAVAWMKSDAAFCTEGSGCDVIQDSAWSTLLFMPMALWGFALYALIGAFALYPRTSRIRRWRHLWRLSLLGLAISLYLTAVGFIVLDTFCVWCLLSLATIASIFVLVHIQRPATAPGTRWSSWLLGNGLVVVGLLLALQVHQSGVLLERPEDPRLAALVTHLQQSGAKYYGASWCSNCREQKRIFGASARRLPYVECSPGGQGTAVAFECVRAGIEAYPTWVIDGLQHRQVLQPQELAAITGFDWSGHEAK